MSQTGNRASGNGFPLRFNQQQNPSKDSFSLKASKGSGAKFIAHVLGLDHEHEAAGKGRLGGSATAASRDGAGQKALAGMKLSDLFAGFKPTPNFLFLLLFLGFFLWIFVIYWVRHNEPFANQVLGSPKADSHKAAADRRIVAGIKNAFPVQTSASTGEIYVPGTPAVTHPAAPAPHPVALEQSLSSNQALSSGQYLQSAAPVTPAPASPQPFHAQPVGLAPYGTPYMDPQVVPMPQHPGSALPYPQYGGQILSPPVHVGQGNYLVGVQSHSGARVKTIVSR